MWSLVTCESRSAPGKTFVGLMDPDGQVRRHRAVAHLTDVGSVMNNWSELEPVLRELRVDDGEAVDGVRVLPPISTPSKLICVGANYRSHVEEMLGSREVPAGFEPFIFLLPPTSIVGPDEPIVIPADPSAKVDWEAELGVVIGRAARNVAVEDALDVVAGYTVVNDISARGYHRRPDPLAPPFAFDWVRSKGRDSFTPIGPGITPSWFVPDPQALPVRLWRNGTLKQDGNTADMIFGVARLVSAASALMSLNPGDVLATGTPAGVGVVKGESLQVDDVIVIEIGPLERLRNRVRGVEQASAESVAESVGGVVQE